MARPGMMKCFHVPVLPVGSQLKVPHETLGTMLFDVAGHDIYRSPFDSEAHTMVLPMDSIWFSLPYPLTRSFIARQSARR